MTVHELIEKLRRFESTWEVMWVEFPGLADLGVEIGEPHEHKGRVILPRKPLSAGGHSS